MVIQYCWFTHGRRKTSHPSETKQGSLYSKQCTSFWGKSLKITIDLHQVPYPPKWVPFNDRWQNPSISTPSFPCHNACCSINATTETRLGFKEQVGKTEHFQWPSVPLSLKTYTEKVVFFFDTSKTIARLIWIVKVTDVLFYLTILYPESLGGRFI